MSSDLRIKNFPPSEYSKIEEGELHIILLWEKARHKEAEILADISKNLEILETYDIKWTRKNVSDNYTRFYGLKLENQSVKEIECGIGRFLMVAVWDANPRYEFVETSRGHEYINTNIFSLKTRYRDWTKGGHKIHTTNTPKETNHDITLLIGKNYNDYLSHAAQNRKPRPILLDRDLTGCGGWKNLDELFYVLDATSDYFVLRNHECLPREFASKEHGDIDIMVRDFQNALFILNAKKVFKKKYRVHCKNIVAGAEVFWDIRFAGDRYYCAEWGEKMFDSRIKNAKGIRVLDDENYFYSLVYHALVHKSKISPDYYGKAETLFKKMQTPNLQNDFSHPFDFYFLLLKDFMRRNGYSFTAPKDKSVFYNAALLQTSDIAKYLEKNFFLENLSPIMLNLGSNLGCIYFVGWLGPQKLFVKWGGIGDSARNEYTFAKRLYDANPANFVRPHFYKHDGPHKFVAMDFVEGQMLDGIKLADKQRDSVARQLYDIGDTLCKTRCVHRDIRPANFILASDGRLKLIDAQFMVDFDNYNENSAIMKTPHILRRLGDTFAPGNFAWDDMYSLSKMFDELQLAHNHADIAEKIKSKIGGMRVRAGKAVNKYRKRKILKFISAFVPVKSWRRKIRDL